MNNNRKIKKNEVINKNNDEMSENNDERERIAMERLRKMKLWISIMMKESE